MTDTFDDLDEPDYWDDDQMPEREPDWDDDLERAEAEWAALPWWERMRARWDSWRYYRRLMRQAPRRGRGAAPDDSPIEPDPNAPF